MLYLVLYWDVVVKGCMMGVGWNFLCECAEVSSYIDFYKDVDLFEGNKAGFYVVCSGAFVQDQKKTRLFFSIEIYRVV